ncbi:MAG TPA: AAA family ATPase, partial [Kofleriaceae bacterium]
MLAQLDRWLDAPGERGWVVVTGGPGMGKSAILSAWLARHEAFGRVPYHLIRRQVADWDQPEVIAAALAAQIEAMFPALRDADAKPDRRLLELLGRVSRQLGAADRLVVVVDGLDETRAEPGENPLPRFLPHTLPPGIRFLCATRPTDPHLPWLQARGPVCRLDLDDPTWAASNDAAVRGFWTAVAPRYQPALSDQTIAEAIERAEGNVMHAVMLHEALRQLPAERRRVDRIPTGLRALISSIWDIISREDSVCHGLGLLCAAREALSLELLAELAGWKHADKKRFVRDARQLLLEEPASWADAAAFRPRHDWVREAITDDLGASAMREHHATLSRALAIWPARSEATARRYALRHTLTHRIEAGDCASAVALASDLGFLEAKCRELGVHEAEADVARLAERCRASSDDVLARRAGDLVRALARESHWLHAAPEATCAVVWNRLQRLGWSLEDLDALRVPDGASFLRVRHAQTRESPALLRNLEGHTDSVNACVVTPNGRHVVSASGDQTLKVWDLASGRALASLEGHTDWVRACAVTPDGRHVVSASSDHTLKVWRLDTHACCLTHRGDGPFFAVAATTTAIVAGDRAGSLWFLDVPRRDHSSEPSAARDENHD